jgi:hypothetical protein
MASQREPRSPSRSGTSDDELPPGAPVPSSGSDATGGSTRNELSSGYSQRSSANGTAGDALDVPGAGDASDANEPIDPAERDPLAREGVTAGAAGPSRDRITERETGHAGESGRKDDERASRDDARPIGGIAGVSGGDRSPTPSGRTVR